MATSRRDSASAQSATEHLIKSKERVRDLAEVYTAEREVRAMLTDTVGGWDTTLPRAEAIELVQSLA